MTYYVWIMVAICVVAAVYFTKDFISDEREERRYRREEDNDARVVAEIRSKGLEDTARDILLKAYRKAESERLSKGRITRGRVLEIYLPYYKDALRPVMDYMDDEEISTYRNGDGSDMQGLVDKFYPSGIDSMYHIRWTL